MFAAAPAQPPGGVSRGSSVFGQTNQSSGLFGSSPAFAAVSSNTEQDSIPFGSAQPPGASRGASSAFRFSSASSKPNSSSKSLRLTLCQNADGSFPADHSTATVLGWENLQELLDHGLAVVEDPVVWSTICCLLYLEEKCQPEKESWELVAQKATRWLQSRGVDEKTIREKARQLLRREKLEGRRRIVCPEGHSLSAVPLEKASQQPWFCDSGDQCAGGPHRGAQPWRCQQDWRVQPGGHCDFDICSVCVASQTSAT